MNYDSLANGKQNSMRADQIINKQKEQWPKNDEGRACIVVKLKKKNPQAEMSKIFISTAEIPLRFGIKSLVPSCRTNLSPFTKDFRGGARL